MPPWLRCCQHYYDWYNEKNFVLKVLSFAQFEIRKKIIDLFDSKILSCNIACKSLTRSFQGVKKAKRANIKSQSLWILFILYCNVHFFFGQNKSYTSRGYNMNFFGSLTVFLPAPINHSDYHIIDRFERKGSHNT